MFLFLKPVIRAACLCLSVDKLITDHLPHICILFFFFTECAWSNLSAAPSDHFQRIQISAERTH